MSESIEKIISPDTRDPFAALEYIIHEEETRKKLLEHGETFSQQWELERITSRKIQLKTIRDMLARLNGGNVDDELKVKLNKAWEELKDLENKFS